MDELNDLLQNMLNATLIRITLSDPRAKEGAFKSKVRPVFTGDALLFQETLYIGAQVFHHNYTKEDMCSHLEDELRDTFRQAQLTDACKDATVLVSKKGRVTIKVRDKSNCSPDPKENDPYRLSHDRKKHYILQDGIPVDFLVELGVQRPDGKVNAARYDKFKQVNRYLEYIDDVLPKLPTERTLRIIDFGCGKSYLTFAVYYYLHEIKGLDILVTGLDLKEDVIDNCNALAVKCGYEKLHFEKGDIATYNNDSSGIDMVISLHACDTATDYALEKAVNWGAGVILAVPCCQHEVNTQISCPVLEPILEYGIIKERISALVTDGVRAELLKQNGYDVQVLEFTEMEHTPKNLMIRAVKNAKMRPGQANDTTFKLDDKKYTVQEMMDFLNISPTLSRLLEQDDSLIRHQDH